MPSLNRYEKVPCENCGAQTTTLNLARHKKSCSAGTLYCSFSTNSQNDLNYHIDKKHSAPKPDVTFKCILCFQEFPGFYVLHQHRNTQQGKQVGSRTMNVDVEHIVGDVEDHKLREELRSCQQERDTKYSITQWKLSRKQSWTKNLISFSTVWNVQQKWIWLLNSIGKYRRWRVQIFFTHTKTIPCWIDPSLCAPRRLGKIERFSQQNWRNRVL